MTQSVRVSANPSGRDTEDELAERKSGGRTIIQRDYNNPDGKFEHLSWGCGTNEGEWKRFQTDPKARADSTGMRAPRENRRSRASERNCPREKVYTREFQAEQTLQQFTKPGSHQHWWSKVK